MLLNKNQQKIFCFYCNKWYNIYIDVFLNVLYEQSITCTENHLVGNQYDSEWLNYFYGCPYYYLYHNKGQCRCIQEETNCEGLNYNCSNPLGKKSYEEDLEEK